MKATTHILSFDGGFLQRGFWLYVWEVTTEQGSRYYYVGRTGDASSTNAQSPFNRMGQHLGSNPASNMLRNHLQNKDISINGCNFRLIAYGPILEEAGTRDEHNKRKDIVAGIEKALADSFRDAGYDVLNTVISNKKLDPQLWENVRQAFVAYFPAIEKSALRNTAKT